MRRMPTSFPAPVSADRAGQRLLPWALGLLGGQREAPAQASCWRSERACRSLSHCVSYGCCFPPPERPGLLWKLFCPVQAQGHTVVSSPPLTSHQLPSESTAWGTVCAVDSPALTFLPLKQALRLEQAWAGTWGCSPLFLPKSSPPHPTSLAVPTRAPSVALPFCCF